MYYSAGLCYECVHEKSQRILKEVLIRSRRGGRLMKIKSKDKTKAKPKAGEKAKGKTQKSEPMEETQQELTEKQAGEVVGGIVRRL
jgi:U3 small nucleolar RNA-associated protein 14